MGLLVALLGAYILYVLQKYLYKRFWNKNLTVELTFSKEAAIEGEDMSLLEVITNRKLLPIPVLQVKFMVARGLEFKDAANSKVSDQLYRNDMISVLMYQRLTRTLDICCAHRGYYTINRADVVCANLFLNHEEIKLYDLNTSLWVFPGPVDSSRLDIIFSHIFGTVLTKRFVNEDPFEFRNIREYQPYDSLKTVNWKASAKTGAFKVNTHDATSSQQVKIIINTQPETIWRYDDLSEESIRIASALAGQFTGRGIPVSVAANARDLITKEITRIPAGSGSSHYRAIQEVLARIDLTLEPAAIQPILQKEISNTSEQDFIILISYNQKLEIQQLMMSEMMVNRDFVWLIPINNEVKVTVGHDLNTKVIPWELKAE